MVNLGCQDTEWLGERKRQVLDVILLQNGLTRAPVGMDKEKCGCLGSISGWFGALRVTVGGLRVLVRLKSERRLRCSFTTKWAHTSHFGHGKRKM